MLSFYTSWQTKKDDTGSTKLPDDMSEYMVYMTREALSSFTSSMSKMCSGTENFFHQMSCMLAYERTMRNLTSWTMPATAPWMSAMPHSWTSFAPQTMAGMPFWNQQYQPFPFMGLSTMTTLGQSFPPYTASVPAYYSAMAMHPSSWSYNPYLSKFV